MEKLQELIVVAVGLLLVYGGSAAVAVEFLKRIAGGLVTPVVATVLSALISGALVANQMILVQHTDWWLAIPAILLAFIMPKALYDPVKAKAVELQAAKLRLAAAKEASK